MRTTCEKCGKTYDDADCWTICPHHSLEWCVDGPNGPKDPPIPEGTFVLITTIKGSIVAQVTAEDTDDPANTSVVFYPSGGHQLMKNRELNPILVNRDSDIALTYLFKRVREDTRKIDELDCTLDDEETAHRETLAQLNTARGYEGKA